VSSWHLLVQRPTTSLASAAPREDGDETTRAVLASRWINSKLATGFGGDEIKAPIERLEWAR
jgi:hypothetical protein